MKPLETLRVLGTGGEAPADAKERVYGALLATLAAAATTTAAAAVAPLDGSAPAGTLLPASAPLLAGLSSAKGLALAAGIWLIGAATGAALYSALHPQEVRIVYVDRPAPPSTVVAPLAESAPSASASSVPLASAIDPSSKRVATVTVGPVSQLARERALLDLARADAARGEPTLSLSETEQHRSQFPRGKLAEEREALAIRALHSLGRTDEARARAQAFRLAYPNSFLTPAIDSALSAP